MDRRAGATGEVNCMMVRYAPFIGTFFFQLHKVEPCSIQLLSHAQFFATHEPQHARPPCPSPTPGVPPNPCPSIQWCHPTISSSVVPFSSCRHSFPASGSFQMSQLFTSGGQSIGISASASILPVNIQDWFPLGWTGWISLQSKGLSRVFSNTTMRQPQSCVQLQGETSLLIGTVVRF